MTSSVSSEFLADDSNEFHDCSTEDIIQSALLQYFSAVNTSMQTDSSLDDVLQTGLTHSLAKDIAVNYEFLFDQELLHEMYSYIAAEYLEVIHQIILSSTFVQTRPDNEM